MTILPTDLSQKIHEQFSSKPTCKELSDSLEKLWDENINVGAEQLARAIIFLADGNYDLFWELRRTFLGDPRDLLCEANSKLQNSGYWFSKPYSEMGPLRTEPINE